MSELLNQLGINWKLLLSQGVNFLILLTALTFLVYRPLQKVLEERKRKIELGIKAGEEVEKRLKEIDEAGREKIKEANQKALGIISASEGRAEEKAKGIVLTAEEKASNILEAAGEIAKKKKTEDMENIFKEAKALVREAISKTVELDPALVDEKLISKSLEEIKHKTNEV